MSKKVAVLAVNPVNGMGLFQYLEAFFENGIEYRLFAVAPNKEIVTNSGIGLIADDTVANLKGKQAEYDALVFGCGDAIPKFAENADKQHNIDMLEIIKAFGDADKLLIGHCAAGMIFDLVGVANNKNIALHPLAKEAIKKATATDKEYVVDGTLYTAKDENSIYKMLPELIKVLKE